MSERRGAVPSQGRRPGGRFNQLTTVAGRGRHCMEHTPPHHEGHRAPGDSPGRLSPRTRELGGHRPRPPQHRQDEAWERLTDLSSSHSALGQEGPSGHRYPQINARPHRSLLQNQRPRCLTAYTLLHVAFCRRTPQAGPRGHSVPGHTLSTALTPPRPLPGPVHLGASKPVKSPVNEPRHLFTGLGAVVWNRAR